jgi:ABC-type uncharacterized transport system involved in gliding motility auxiliary subunit
LLTVVTGLLLAAALGVVNWMAHRRPVEWDLTRARLHTLSPATERALAALPAPARVEAYYRADEAAHAPARDLLRRYAERSGHLEFEMVDPFRDPDRARAQGVTDAGARVVVTVGAERARLRSLDEETLTNALLRLSHPGTRRVYFTEGHGEPSLADASRGGLSGAARALAAEGLEALPLPFLASGGVPADAAAVLVPGPRRRLLDAEVEALRRYLAGGGHVGLLVEPEVDAGLDPLLRDLGVEADADVVVDPSPASRLAGATPVMPAGRAAGRHPVADRLGGAGVVLPTARSLVALRGARARPQPLVLSADTAWGETDVPSVFAGRARLDEGEKVGPLPLAMAVQWTVEGPPRREARGVVVGDADFATNGYQSILGNLDLLVGAAAWLAEQDDRLTIPSRAREASRLALTEGQVTALKFVAVDLVPLLILVAGLAVWLGRRAG